MWEISVSYNSNHFKSANFIFEYMLKYTSEFGVYIKKFEANNVISIMLACEDYDKDRVKIFLSNSIIESICTFFKEEFLNKTLNLPIKDGMYYEALKKALISFDKETDAFLVAKELSLEKSISVESFFYFKLKPLRDKWEELASIANDNGYFLICNENFIDLLKFLIDNLEITHDLISVYLDGDNFRLTDELDKIIDIGDDDIITSLIGLCPREIVLYGEKYDSEKLSLLMKIFDKRVKFDSASKFQ